MSGIFANHLEDDDGIDSGDFCFAQPDLLPSDDEFLDTFESFVPPVSLSLPSKMPQSSRGVEVPWRQTKKRKREVIEIDGDGDHGDDDDGDDDDIAIISKPAPKVLKVSESHDTKLELEATKDETEAVVHKDLGSESREEINATQLFALLSESQHGMLLSCPKENEEMQLRLELSQEEALEEAPYSLSLALSDDE